LSTLQLTKHLSEKRHESSESWPRWILRVWHRTENLVALLVPLTTRIQHCFQEGLLLFFRND
jgi:ABC-type sulfate transport system permease subunit